MANGTTKVTRTFGSPTNNIKWTWSAWVKICQTQEQGLFFGYVDASNYSHIALSSSGQLQLYNHAGGGASGNKKTTALFRDPTAWYHFVACFDSANATATDRMKLYVNGVRETVFSSDSDPSSSAASKINGAWLHEIGAKLGSYNLAGYMSNIHFCDGQAYTPSDFGETDSTSGIWKIKTSPSVTYGNNGYFLKMEDSTNMDLDSSSNAATFSTTGTLNLSKDNPSNSFCNWNSRSSGLNDFSNVALNSGGLQWVSTSYERQAIGTLPIGKGKWYWEVYLNDGNQPQIGVADSALMNNFVSAEVNSSTSYRHGLYYAYTNWNGSSGTGTIYLATAAGVANANAIWTTGDYLGIAYDGDTGKYWMSKNGTFVDDASGNTPNVASGTYPLFTTPISDTMVPWTGGTGSGSSRTYSWNFGGGYFGTAVAGTEDDEGGEGLFKYNPPSGFRALCTNNVKEYG